MTNTTDAEKKPRSAAYPAISIQDAIELVSQLKRSFPTSSFKREDASAVLNKVGIARELAAAVHFGLLERTGDEYKLSSRVQSILTYVSEEERSSAIIDCFKSPKLYSDLIEKFKGHAVPPDPQLKAILVRFHQITEGAAPQAAEIFIENATFCGVLNEHRILFPEGGIPSQSQEIEQNNYNSNDSEANNAVHSKTEPPKNGEVSTQVNGSSAKPTFLLEQMNGSIDLKIHLSEKKYARLIYPDNLNEKDIQILKLQLEALALTL